MKMEPQITVYSKPVCPGCTAVKRRLDGDGLPYNEVDMTKDPAALEMVKGLGYAQAPVVVYQDGTDVHHFSGFNPGEMATLRDRLDGLLAAA